MPTIPYRPEFIANGGAFGREVAVASDVDRFMLVWEGPNAPPPPDRDYDSDYNELLGRIFQVEQAATGVFQVNTVEDDPQFDPEIVRYGDGSYLVAYSSGVEDSLEGTFIATQRVGVDGAKLGPEVYSPNYSYYHREPDAAVLSDGRSVVVSTEEFDVEALIYNAAGAVVADYALGFNVSGAAAVARHPVLADRVIVFWQGYAVEEPGDDDVRGLYWQELDVDDGTRGPAQLIQALPDNFDADPSAVTMRIGDRINLAYAAPDGGGRDVKLYSLPFDGVSTPYAITVNEATAGDQVRPAIDDLDGERVIVAWEDRQAGADDASGSSIRARLVDTVAGAADGPAFLVNQVTAGDQRGPSVAQVDEGIFVVAWTDGDGVKARLFDADGDYFLPALTSTLVTRLETQDGSDSLDQRLRGFDAPQSYFFEIGAETGDDVVTDFARDDVLVTDAPLFDGNGDGIITFSGGRLRLDGRTAGGDTVRLDGLDGSALRYVGRDEGLSVYATASVRPAGATEVLLGSTGAAGTRGADLFFYDAALCLPSGRSYAITGFGAADVFVTTVAIADNDGDGRIGFGSDRRVEVDGSDFAVTRSDGRRVTAFEFDGAVMRDGTTYYVYSLIGSAVGVDALG
ncbi:hypothetical protein [Sphingomonas lenta]|uniref:Uncharacterized protein n=1 Tax=Sphingomonas lenta TaxID=1141887 RepID=A0A2A2SDM7_9SPHN|nr:hypothetical protein [Sphingomonas lenta]PAX07292.1 hypothetical protein CKY28_14835 [Sphingomonas lenta]